MGALRGAVTGGLGLTTMYLVVTSKNKQLADAASLPGKALHWLIDPAVPLIPDRKITPSTAAPSAFITPTPTPGSTTSGTGTIQV